jgi:glycosyltransferase involved in cell wall biosynthesis
MISIEFDGVIYALQRFGGASVYWRNIVERVQLDGRFRATELRPRRSARGIPVWSRADVFHSSHFRTTCLSQAKTVTTVHDLTYELGMLGNGLKAKLNILERKKSYFDADAIICISENTRKDLLEIYPQLAGQCPIHVIHHGFTMPDFDHRRLPGGLKENEYLLYVGGRKNYKNFTLALRGYVESGVWRNGVKLVCTGSEFTEQELESFRQMKVAHSLVSVGLVDESTLFRLYKHAHCLLYTSRYEGFGLPLIEAMSMGCPVIGADVSCIPEIVGKAGLLVDADSPDQLARAILDLRNQPVRDRFIGEGLRRASQFSWNSSASKHMEVYASIATSN